MCRARWGATCPDRPSPSRSSAGAASAWCASSSVSGPRTPAPRGRFRNVLQPVAVGTKLLSDYTHIVGRELIAEIKELAAPLEGRKVVHVSATAFGGGVSEILYTLVPLMRDVGLEVEWQVIYGREEFFNATKLMHNALQGNPQDLTEDQWATWSQYNEMNARELSGGWDVCIVHDPQPAPLFQLVPEKAKGWVWRCHIDLSTPNEQTIAHLLPYIQDYPESLFHMRED